MRGALYEDQGPPLRVQGYASRFGQPYWLAGTRTWETVAPGAFDLSSPRPVPVLFAHEPSMRYAPRVTLFQDETGLAFEFELPRSWAGLQLASAIRRGAVRQASVMFAAGGRTVRRRVEAGVPTDVVTRARVTEISLCNTAANPWSAVWLDDETADELGPELAQDRARWILGRQQAQLEAGRQRTRRRGDASQTPASALAVIDDILARGRPRCWIGCSPGPRPGR